MKQIILFLFLAWKKDDIRETDNWVETWSRYLKYKIKLAYLKSFTFCKVWFHRMTKDIIFMQQ